MIYANMNKANMFYVMDVALIQAVIMPALCFLKIVGKKATRTQVSRVLPNIFFMQTLTNQKKRFLFDWILRLHDFK